jgi:hypothetical protein
MPPLVESSAWRSLSSLRLSASCACLRAVMSRATAWNPVTFLPSVTICTFWPNHTSVPPLATAGNSK